VRWADRKHAGAALLLLLMAACSNAPATLSSPKQYARIGVLPAYEKEIVRRTPPGLLDNAVVEHFDLDVGVNRLAVERITKSMGQAREIVDLQSFAATYIGAPKVYSSGERKIFGDSRPLFTEVVKSAVGAQRLDAYMVIEGGPIRLYEPQVAPAIQLFAAQGHDLSMQMTIYVIDGRIFEIAAVSRAILVRRRVPDPWFVAPKQHTDEIGDAVIDLLDKNLGPALQKLGLI
jgi:hypothetical protein